MAIRAGETVRLNEEFISQRGISLAVADRIVAVESAEAARREILYRLDRPTVPVEGRVVIVVDDGVATGATASAALRALRQRNPNRIIFAAPMCSSEGVALLTRGRRHGLRRTSMP